MTHPMKKHFVHLLVAAVALVAASCASTHSTPMPTDHLTFNRDETWVLTAIKQKEVVYADDQEKVTLQFNPETGNISGCAGCNHYFGNYLFKSDTDTQGQLAITQVGATQMMCPDEVMRLESTLLPLLSKVTHCTLTAYRLTLRQGSKVLLEFEKQ